MRRPTERTYRSKRIGWWLPAGAQTSQSVSPSSISAACRRPWPPRSATTCLQTEQRSGFASMRSPLMDILSPIDAVRANLRCLTAGLWVGARNRSYAGYRLPLRFRSCGVCTNLKGDDPPPYSRSNGSASTTPPILGPFGAGSTAFSVRSELYLPPDRVSQRQRRKGDHPAVRTRDSAWRTEMQPGGTRSIDPADQSNHSGG